MAAFTPVRGTRAEIAAVSKQDGQFLFETDQGIGNRILVDYVDETTGDVERVQVGGDRGATDFVLNKLGDVNVTTRNNGDYLKYNGTTWVNDSTLSPKVQNLTNQGKLNGQYVEYSSTKNIITALDEKIGIASPVNNSYLYYNGSNWTCDDGLASKVQNLTNLGQLDAVNVTYNSTSNVKDALDGKISMPNTSTATVGDALVLGTGNTPQWKKVTVTVIDSLSSTSTTDPLSANQGKNLKGMVDDLSALLANKIDKPTNEGQEGYVLGLDGELHTIWKPSGGGGVGGDWTDITSKPFSTINSTDDFTVTTSGQLKAKDANYYRPTDTDLIGASTISYMPCSASVGGVETKKKISWSDLSDRIEQEMFDLTDPATGDIAVYDATAGKWVNDSTAKDKMFTPDGTTIKNTSGTIGVNLDEKTLKYNGTSKVVEVSVDGTSLKYNNATGKKYLEVPFDGTSIKADASGVKVPVDGETIVADATSVRVPIDGNTIVADGGEVKVPIDAKTLQLKSDELVVALDGQTLKYNDATGKKCVEVAVDGKTLKYNATSGKEYLEVPFDDRDFTYNSTSGKIESTTIQIEGVAVGTENTTFSFTDTTAIGGTDDYLLDIYCNDGSKFVTSQTISGHVLTVTFNGAITDPVVICVATKGKF